MENIEDKIEKSRWEKAINFTKNKVVVPLVLATGLALGAANCGSGSEQSILGAWYTSQAPYSNPERCFVVCETKVKWGQDSCFKLRSEGSYRNRPSTIDGNTVISYSHNHSEVESKLFFSEISQNSALIVIWEDDRYSPSIPFNRVGSAAEYCPDF